MSQQLTEALEKCQEAAGRAPAFVRPYLVPVQDFAAVVVQELLELRAGLEMERACSAVERDARSAALLGQKEG